MLFQRRGKKSVITNDDYSVFGSLPWRVWKIFVEERFSISLLSQSDKTSAINAKEISHASVVLFFFKFTFSKHFILQKKTFWSAACNNVLFHKKRTTVARARFGQHKDLSYVTLGQSVLSKRSPIDNTCYIVNTDLVTQEHPAAPKVSKHAYTFERGKITYLNSMSFLPQT